MSRVISIWVIIATLLFSCSQPADKRSGKKSIDKQPANESVPKAPESHSPDTISFDWYGLKETIRFLNCGERISREKQWFNLPDGKPLLYEYCAHNANQAPEHRQSNRPDDDKLIEAIVLKTDGKIGQYGDRNEQLLFLHVSAEITALGKWNYVGKSPEAIRKALGEPQTDTLDMLVYEYGKQVLLFKYNGKMVTDFRYYGNFDRKKSVKGLVKQVKW